MGAIIVLFARRKKDHVNDVNKEEWFRVSGHFFRNHQPANDDVK